MPRPCSICSHPARDDIDRALLASTEPYRTIAERFGTSATSLFRHRADHLAITRVQAQAAAEESRADSLLEQLKALQQRTLGILDQAEEAGRLATAVMAIHEARLNLELLAKLLGELDDRPQVNVLVAPEWIQVRTAVMLALLPFPEARSAVAAALEAA